MRRRTRSEPSAGSTRAGAHVESGRGEATAGGGAQGSRERQGKGPRGGAPASGRNVHHLPLPRRPPAAGDLHILRPVEKNRHGPKIRHPQDPGRPLSSHGSSFPPRIRSPWPGLAHSLTGTGTDRAVIGRHPDPFGGVRLMLHVSPAGWNQIGRASCRERVSSPV